MEKINNNSANIPELNSNMDAAPVPEPTTYIVIANWNGIKTLQRCLTSVFANSNKSTFKVVVVDNASSDGSTEMLRAKFPDVQVIRNKENVGYSKANNQAIRHSLACGAENILLLNNDIEITDGKWLEELIAVLESDSQIGIVGCKLLFPDGKIQHAGGVVELRGAYNRGEFEKDVGQFNRKEFVDFVTGAVLLIKSTVVRQIGLLDEGFSPLYYEDTDWCFRAHFCGYKIVYTPTPEVIHHCGLSAKKLHNKKLFYNRRSSIRFVLLNFELMDIIKRILKYESRAAVGCIFGRNPGKRSPLSLRSDASSRVLFFINEWAPSFLNLGGIIALRQRRLKCIPTRKSPHMLRPTTRI